VNHARRKKSQPVTARVLIAMIVAEETIVDSVIVIEIAIEDESVIDTTNTKVNTAKIDVAEPFLPMLSFLPAANL
jgi:hypothetical protein